MARIVALLTLSLFVVGCGKDEQRPASPSAIPAPSPPAPAGRAITVGEAVSDTLTEHGTHRLFELTAPSDGTLEAQLSWDRHQGSLELWIEDAQFVTSVSPAIGKLRVAAGRTYRVRVEDAAPWDYDALAVSFTLTTALE